MTMWLALLGFAPTETQAKYPPVLGWVALVVGGYFTAWVIELVSWLAPALSVYFRTIGVIAVALLVQAVIRSVFARDSLSWSGWLRLVITRGA